MKYYNNNNIEITKRILNVYDWGYSYTEYYKNGTFMHKISGGERPRIEHGNYEIKWGGEVLSNIETTYL